MLQGRDSGEAPPTSVLKVTTKNQTKRSGQCCQYLEQLNVHFARDRFAAGERSHLPDDAVLARLVLGLARLAAD